jgi:glycogen synthase
VDTVRSYTAAEGTGFGFDGSTKAEVLKNLIGTAKEALNFYTNRKVDFKQLQRRGFNERFLWSTAAKEYIEKLYKPAISEKD